ncbi:MAG: hypothetical protein WCE75_09945 [Terracidiphilus sp.]
MRMQKQSTERDARHESGSRRCLAAGTALLLLIAPAALGQSAATVAQVGQTDVVRIALGRGGQHRLEIDDAPSMTTPVVRREFTGDSFELHANEAGLIPGIAYSVRIDGHREAPLVLTPPAEPGGGVDCAVLASTWETTERFLLGTAYSGLRWSGERWEITPHTYLLGESLYNAEMIARPAIAAAWACRDTRTLDQLAQYYLAMLQQTETVAEVEKRPRLTAESRMRLSTSNQAARTFSATFGREAGEGELYNAQWLHPAALLARLVTLLPASERSAAMKDFAAQYAGFIVRDQLRRYFYEQRQPALGGVQATGRVAKWELAMQGLKGAKLSDSAMSDIDLWLLASAAEVLGANANEPKLAPIEAGDLALLRRAVRIGIRFFESRRSFDAATRDFAGKVVGSACYFRGDYASEEEMAFSGVEDARFPAPAERKPRPDISWDISHIYRLPIFLRALYENRKATGASFPLFQDLQLAANQYVYRVFNGNFRQPLFHNYFDGSDGWFRVGYNGADAGYPPSAQCDMRNAKRLCTIPGSIVGWAEIAFASPDLARLEGALIGLGFREDAATRAFRDRYYFYGAAYGPGRAAGRDLYAGALYPVAAENAQWLTPR